jgi:hypothetical protein
MMMMIMMNPALKIKMSGLKCKVNHNQMVHD